MLQYKEPNRTARYCNVVLACSRRIRTASAAPAAPVACSQYKQTALPVKLTCEFRTDSSIISNLFYCSFFPIFFSVRVCAWGWRPCQISTIQPASKSSSGAVNWPKLAAKHGHRTTPRPRQNPLVSANPVRPLNNGLMCCLRHPRKDESPKHSLTASQVWHISVWYDECPRRAIWPLVNSLHTPSPTSQ